jgi:hypothetical protein
MTLVALFCRKNMDREVPDSHCFECEDNSLLDMAPCTIVRVDRLSTGAYCLHHQGEMSFYFSDPTQQYNR